MLTRRSLFVLPALLAAPAIVRAASLMKVKPVELDFAMRPLWRTDRLGMWPDALPSTVNQFMREHFALARLYRESLDRELEVAKRYMSGTG